MGKRKIVIAIDGYSACGKSTTAKEAAAHLNYAYIDTGAMYRAVTLYFLDHYVNYKLDKEVEEALEHIQIGFKPNGETGQSETYLNDVNVEDEIRTMRISQKVSEVSSIPQVRHKMVEQQQRLGKDRGVVMDGRDIGTTVFPDAELKLFMTADTRVRAYRRQKELLAKDQLVDLDAIIKNIKERDYIDTHREESPLTRADDALLIDTTELTIDQQVSYVLRLVDEKIKKLEEQNT